MTWLIGNGVPQIVTAVTQQIKPDMYPNVDDIVLQLVKQPVQATSVRGTD